MIIAIGDVHGHLHQLKSLFYNLRERFDLTQHRIVFVGDYVDGGPDTKGVIEFIRNLETDHNVVCLMGNHEQMLLNSLADTTNMQNHWHWYTQGGRQTIWSYIPDGLSSYDRALFPDNADAVDTQHIEWMENLPIMYESKNFYFVHAGFNPLYSVEDQNTLDMLWIREDFIDSDHDFGKRVVFGHTYHPEPVVHKNKIGLDTMHRGGGYLVAAILDDETGELREFIRS